MAVTGSQRGWMVSAAAAALCLAVSACGSQLDPATVAQTSAGTQGGIVAGDGSVVEPGTVDTDGDGTLDPGGSTDPGTGSVDGSDTGDDSGSDSPDGTDTGGDENSADGGVKAGSCDGFKNQTGITDDKIVVANASDISGPVPGLFQAAQDAAKAFVAYYNSTTKLCGRSLELLALDSRSDAGGDQQAYTRACSEAFAVIGSVSSQDQGGANTAAQCGLPDIRAFVTTPDRSECASCYSAYTITPKSIAASLPKYYLAKEKEASQHVAIFYVNVPAAAINAEAFAGGFERAGMNVDVLQGIDTSEFNYSPYVQQMKENDIDFVQYFGPYQFAIRLQQAMQQQNFKPAVYLEDPTIYDQNYVDSAGEAGEGSQVYSVIQRFDDTSIPEMALYRQWLNQVNPGAIPNYYGLFAWSAARLFVQRATALGGKLTRESLLGSLKTVDDWTSNGLHAPMHVGSKETSGCIKIFQLGGGKWSQVSPGDFMCGPTVATGVG